CCFQPRISALVSLPPRLQATTTTLPFRVVRTITSRSEQMTTPNPDHEHFFRYTSGRWLWDKEQQLRDRYRAFDVAELQRLAAKTVRSDSCISITKLAEGGYNKVFRLIINDGKRVLARIPNPNTGLEFYSTVSKVATIELARDFLQIPVPRVFDWSATSNNAVGSEYIIIEEASGTQLGLIWNQLSPDKKLSIIREIVTIELKMLTVSFSHFGSIYFASDTVESVVLALLTSESSSELKERVYKKFSIGPTVDRSFWNKERSSIVDQKFYRSETNKRSYSDFFSSEQSTSISAAVGEAGLLFLQSQPSPIVDYLGSILLQRLDNFDDLGPEQQAEIKQKIFKSTLYQLYLLETKERNPLLAKAFYLDYRKTRRLPIEFAGNTWDNDIVSFREDELHSHSVDAEGWNKVQDFFNSIEGLVKRDRWTYPDTFDSAFNFFSELRERGLKNMIGEEKRAFDRQTRWARKQGDSRAYGISQH
ncbi:hypothetical protein N7449_000552, partial [Penicillium cf. viridicatum]